MGGCSNELANVCYTLAGLCVCAVASSALVAMFNPAMANMCIVLLGFAVCLVILGNCLQKRNKLALNVLYCGALGSMLSPLIVYVACQFAGAPSAIYLASVFVLPALFSIAVLLRIRSQDCRDDFR